MINAKSQVVILKKVPSMESDKSRVTQAVFAGYTLLELLIVVSIMVTLFFFGFASYRDYQRRQQLESGIRQIKSDLRVAQQYAIASKKPETPSGNACITSPLNGYAFTRIDSVSYKIEADCGNSVRVPVGDTIKLADGVQLVSISGTPIDTVVFHVLGRGVDRVGDTTFTLRLIATGTTAQVIVTPSGEIK